MVGVVGVFRSEQNKLPTSMSYNPFLQTNGITPKVDPSLSMTTFESSVNFFELRWYFYILLFLYSNVIGCKLFFVGLVY
jgi:hypothetical protein